MFSDSPLMQLVTRASQRRKIPLMMIFLRTNQEIFKRPQFFTKDLVIVMVYRQQTFRQFFE